MMSDLKERMRHHNNETRAIILVGEILDLYKELWHTAKAIVKDKLDGNGRGNG
jgi:hypothetical protein